MSALGDQLRVAADQIAATVALTGHEKRALADFLREAAHRHDRVEDNAAGRVAAERAADSLHRIVRNHRRARRSANAAPIVLAGFWLAAMLGLAVWGLAALALRS